MATTLKLLTLNNNKCTGWPGVSFSPESCKLIKNKGKFKVAKENLNKKIISFVKNIILRLK